VPVLASQTPGSFLTGAMWNANVKALGDFFAGSGANGVPRFAGYQTTAQSISTATWTSFNIDTELFDSDGAHSTVTNTSRYTATVPGTYMVIGSSGWVSNSTGLRRVRIAVNGVAVFGTGTGAEAQTTSGVSGHITSTLVQLNGTTDYVEVQGHQTTGAALSTSGGSDFSPSLRLFWISG
jgi:hypothetical protein